MESNQQFRMAPRGSRDPSTDAISIIKLPSPGSRGLFTWEETLRVMRKNLSFALALAAIATAVIMTAAFLMRDVYQTTARIEIDQPGSGLRTLQEVESTYADDQDYLETQVQILKSDALAVSVIRALHLDRNREFASSTNAVPMDAPQEPRTQTKSASSSGRSVLQDQLDLADRTPEESAALVVFRSELSVNPIHDSRLIEVSYTSHDPELSQLVTNTLVMHFIDQNYRSRYTTTMRASEWLSVQIDDLRQKVEESNRAVVAYQKQHGLIEADDRTIPQDQLMDDINHQLSDAQASRIEAEAYVRMIDMGQSDAIPSVRNDPVYQNLLTHYADVRAQLAQAKAIYGDQSSNVKKLNDESSELATQIDAERTRVIDQAKTTFEAAQEREQMMLASRETLRSQMGDLSSQMVEYRILKNEAAANAELYNTLQSRLKEAGIYAGLGSSNFHVVDLAPKPNRPTGPHRAMMISIGAMLACSLGVVLSFVRESFDNTVRTPDDVKEWAGLASLAMIPAANQDQARPPRELDRAPDPLDLAPADCPPKHLPKIFDPATHGPQGEAMWNLRTALMLPRSDSGPKVILVTSPASGEGKTTVAVNLAAVLAQTGRTCLMDSDLRGGMVAGALGLREENGLTQLITGSVTLAAAMLRVAEIPNLSILPAGALPTGPADLVCSEAMQSVVTTLRRDFTYVVIDSPPVIPFADARVLSGLADVVVLVSRYGMTTRRAMERSAQLLAAVGAPVAGAVLNNVDLASADYHYYNYGYSRKIKGDSYYTSRDSSTRPPSKSSTETKAKSAQA